MSPPPGDGSPLPPALRYAPVVISRLCLALAAVAVRAPNGVEAYIREAFTLAQVKKSTLRFHDAVLYGTVWLTSLRLVGRTEEDVAPWMANLF